MTHGGPPLAFNGTVADEREVLDACLNRLHVGAGQVVRSVTSSASSGMGRDGSVSAASFPARTARSGSRGSGSTGA
jgi:hypothetical protein